MLISLRPLIKQDIQYVARFSDLLYDFFSFATGVYGGGKGVLCIRTFVLAGLLAFSFCHLFC